MQLIRSLIFLIALLFSSSLWAAIYVDNTTSGCSTPSDTDYDPNNGIGTCGAGSDTVWNTIDGAADAASRGDTIYVRAGTYTEQITLTDGTGTGEGDRITIENYSAESVLVDATGVTCAGAAFSPSILDFRGANYYTIKGINFQDITDGSCGSAVYIASSDWLTLRDFTITNVTRARVVYVDPGTGVSYLWFKNIDITTFATKGFLLQGDVEGQADYVVIEDCTVTDGNSAGGNHDAIQVGSNEGSYSHVVVRNNEVYDLNSYDSGIDMGGHHYLIEDNPGIFGTVPASYYLVENNLMHTNPAYLKVHGHDSHHYIVRYNQLTGNRPLWYNVPNSNQWYNNTFNTGGGNRSFYFHIDQPADCGESMEGLIFKNNVLVDGTPTLIGWTYNNPCNTGDGTRLDTTVFNEVTKTGSILLDGNIYQNTGDIVWLHPNAAQTQESYLIDTAPAAEWAEFVSESGQETNGNYTTQTMAQLFANEANRDYTPAAGSDLLNAGIHLTNADGAGADSSTLVVDNVAYFQDGWTMGSFGVQADWICIGTVVNCVQISSINYGTDTITLVSPMNWIDYDKVWLYKDSDGTITISGPAPDVGAVESGANPVPSGAIIIAERQNGKNN